MDSNLINAENPEYKYKILKVANGLVEHSVLALVKTLEDRSQKGLIPFVSSDKIRTIVGSKVLSSINSDLPKTISKVKLIALYIKGKKSELTEPSSLIDSRFLMRDLQFVRSSILKMVSSLEVVQRQYIMTDVLAVDNKLFNDCVGNPSALGSIADKDYLRDYVRFNKRANQDYSNPNKKIRTQGVGGRKSEKKKQNSLLESNHPRYIQILSRYCDILIRLQNFLIINLTRTSRQEYRSKELQEIRKKRTEYFLEKSRMMHKVRAIESALPNMMKEFEDKSGEASRETLIAMYLSQGFSKNQAKKLAEEELPHFANSKLERDNRKDQLDAYVLKFNEFKGYLKHDDITGIEKLRDEVLNPGHSGLEDIDQRKLAAAIEGTETKLNRRDLRVSKLGKMADSGITRVTDLIGGYGFLNATNAYKAVKFLGKMAFSNPVARYKAIKGNLKDTIYSAKKSIGDLLPNADQVKDVNDFTTGVFNKTRASLNRESLSKFKNDITQKTKEVVSGNMSIFQRNKPEAPKPNFSQYGQENLKQIFRTIESKKSGSVRRLESEETKKSPPLSPDSVLGLEEEAPKKPKPSFFSLDEETPSSPSVFDTPQVSKANQSLGLEEEAPKKPKPSFFSLDEESPVQPKQSITNLVSSTKTPQDFGLLSRNVPVATPTKSIPALFKSPLNNSVSPVHRANESSKLVSSPSKDRTEQIERKVDELLILAHREESLEAPILVTLKDRLNRTKVSKEKSKTRSVIVSKATSGRKGLFRKNTSKVSPQLSSLPKKESSRIDEKDSYDYQNEQNKEQSFRGRFLNSLDKLSKLRESSKKDNSDSLIGSIKSLLSSGIVGGFVKRALASMGLGGIAQVAGGIGVASLAKSGIKAAGRGLGGAAVSGGSLIMSGASRLASMSKGLLGRALALARPMVSSIGSIAMKGMSTARLLGPRLLGLLSNPIAALIGAGMAGWEIGSWINERWGTEIQNAIEVVVDSITKVVSGLSKGMEWVKSLVSDPIGTIKEVGGKIQNLWKGSIFEKFFDDPKTMMTDMASNIASKANSVVSSIPGYNSVKESIAGSTTYRSISKAASNAGNTVSNVATSIGSSAKSAYNSVAERVGGLFKVQPNVDFDGLDPDVSRRFTQMMNEYRALGGTTPGRIESAKRTFEKQAQLHSSDPRRAAAPGTSLHENGRALDIDRETANQLDQKGLLSKYGFSRPVSNEPWHIADTRSVQEKATIRKDPISMGVSGVQTSNTSYERVPSSPIQRAASIPKVGEYFEPSVNTIESRPYTSGASSVNKSIGSPASIPTFSYNDPNFMFMNLGYLSGT